MVKNPPSNAGDAGSIPGWGTKIPHTTGQLNLRAATREKPTMKSLCAAMKTQNSQKRKKKKPTDFQPGAI